MRSLVCPVSPLRIDRQAARITALVMATLMAAYLVSGAALAAITILAAADYFVRAFTTRSTSPVGYFSARLRSIAGLAAKPIDKAPKIFAARVGFLFAASAAALHWVSPDASLVVAGTLMGFALLESVFDVCVGCIVYTYLVLPVLRPDPA